MRARRIVLLVVSALAVTGAVLYAAANLVAPPDAQPTPPIEITLPTTGERPAGERRTSGSSLRPAAVGRTEGRQDDDVGDDRDRKASDRR